MFLLCQFNLMQTIDGLVYSISVISWRSVLLLEEIGVPGENHRPVSSHWQTLSHNVVSSTPRISGFELITTHNLATVGNVEILKQIIMIIFLFSKTKDVTISIEWNLSTFIRLKSVETYFLYEPPSVPIG